MKLKHFFLLLLLAFSLSHDTFAQGEPAHSVLADGEWYKIAIPGQGVYKLDYEFLKNAGIAIDQLNPKNISIWGNGGQMLPQANSTARPADLIENQIHISGEEDGRFNPEDFILMYATGSDTYSFDPVSKSFFYQKNIYSDTSYYFLHIGQKQGLRLTTEENSGITLPAIQVYNQLAVHEVDETNFLATLVGGAGSGRQWFEFISQGDGTKTIDFPAEGLASGRTVKLISAVLGTAYNGTASFKLSINGVPVGQQDVAPLSDSRYATKARNLRDTFEMNTSDLKVAQTLAVRVDFEKNSATGTKAYLDYLFLNYPRNLRLYNDQTIFRSVESLEHTAVTYSIQGVDANTQVWEITDPLKPALQAFQLNNQKALFGRSSEHLRTFVAFNPDSRPAPASILKISKQNLRGLNTPELLIITPKEFLSQANRIAELRQSHDQLKVEVVELEKIYNEFSSGSQDVTALRDFIRHLYLKQAGQLKYVLLFGDCSYDYKDRLTNNTNWIPTYQSRQSVDPVDSYSSDDYLGFLEENEGEWEETDFESDHTMDIGIGRLPVNDQVEAQTVVDKIIHYTTNPATTGDWQKTVTFMADDGDYNSHQSNSEQLAETLHENFPEYNIQKLYLDAFPQTASPSGERSDQMKQAIQETIDKGTLLMNFIGHGSEDFLTDEKILQVSDLAEWSNIDRLPLFVTATCEFGRFDNPKEKSGAEQLLLKNDGGAIALVTTTRPVRSDVNFSLNQAFYGSVFKKNNDKLPIRLGDIFRETKNNSDNKISQRNFSLLGDPSLRLAFSEKALVFTDINDRPVGIDTLKALQKFHLKGHILNSSGGLDETFDGIADIQLRAKPVYRNTIGQAGEPFRYIDRSNKLFQGQASVRKGQFELEAIVPKNINYKIETVELIGYAYQTDEINDASGVASNILLGGSVNAEDDRTPPEIKLYLNDTTYKEGNVTSPNSLLIARLFDEHGINISSAALGQDLTVSLDDNTPIEVNDFYRAAIDDHQTGWLSYPFRDLEDGWHHITLKAWDIYGNSKDATLEFLVADNDRIVLEELINFPNPFTDQTRFSFKHNQAGQDLIIRVDIFNMNGEKVTTIEKEYENSPSHIQNIEWNGKNDSGATIGKGMYVYKVSVTLRNTNVKNQYFQKLVIIN